MATAREHNDVGVSLLNKMVPLLLRHEALTNPNSVVQVMKRNMTAQALWTMPPTVK